MRRFALVIATLLAATSLSACSKCSVPTYGAQACAEKPAIR
jgi:outer membrane protein assembly factor BamE (lipoprotein component of BamABCDE complex)